MATRNIVYNVQVKTGNTAANVQKLGKSAQDTTDRVQRLNTAFRNMANRLIALLVIRQVTGAFTDAIRVTADFEQSIDRLQAITGATTEDLKFFEEQARQIGATTTLTASQAAEAFQLIASAKPDLLDNAQALAEVTRASVTLAEAAGTDLPRAADVLGSALNQFGLQASESNRVINVLAESQKRGAALIDDLGKSFSNVGPVARQAGLSFEETNAALQALAFNGVRGSRAGTQLRSALISLAVSTDKDINPTIVGFQTALKNLADRNITTSDAVDIFQKRIAGTGLILADNAEKIAELTGRFTEDGLNTAVEQAATRTDNLIGDQLRLKSVFEELLIEIGQRYLPTWRNLIQLLTRAIKSILDNAGALESFGRSVIRATQLLSVLGGLILLNRARIVAITAVQAAWTASTIALATAKALLARNTANAAAGFELLRGALAANPLGIAVVAVTTLVGALLLLDKALLVAGGSTARLNKEAAEVASSVARETALLDSLLPVVQDVTEDTNERAKALERLKNQYPEFEKFTLADIDNQTALAEAYEKTTRALVAQEIERREQAALQDINEEIFENLANLTKLQEINANATTAQQERVSSNLIKNVSKRIEQLKIERREVIGNFDAIEDAALKFFKQEAVTQEERDKRDTERIKEANKKFIAEQKQKREEQAQLEKDLERESERQANAARQAAEKAAEEQEQKFQNTKKALEKEIKLREDIAIREAQITFESSDGTAADEIQREIQVTRAKATAIKERQEILRDGVTEERLQAEKLSNDLIFLEQQKQNKITQIQQKETLRRLNEQIELNKRALIIDGATAEEQRLALALDQARRLAEVRKNKGDETLLLEQFAQEFEDLEVKIRTDITSAVLAVDKNALAAQLEQLEISQRERRAALEREGVKNVDIDKQFAEERTQVIVDEIQSRNEEINRRNEQLLSTEFNQGKRGVLQQRQFERAKLIDRRASLERQQREIERAGFTDEVAIERLKAIRAEIAKINGELSDLGKEGTLAENLGLDPEDIENLERWFKAAETAITGVGQVFQDQFTFQLQLLDRQITKREENVSSLRERLKTARFNERVALERDLAAETAALEIANKERQLLEDKRLRSELRFSIAEAIAKGGLVVLNALNTPPFVPAGLAAALVAAAQVAAQISKLQQLKNTFAEGGVIPQGGGVVQGRSHAQGGVKFVTRSGYAGEMEGNEIVLTKGVMGLKNRVSLTGTPKQIASQLNVMGGGIDFAKGAYANKFPVYQSGGIIPNGMNTNDIAKKLDLLISATISKKLTLSVSAVRDKMNELEILERNGL